MTKLAFRYHLAVFALCIALAFLYTGFMLGTIQGADAQRDQSMTLTTEYGMIDGLTPMVYDNVTANTTTGFSGFLATGLAVSATYPMEQGAKVGLVIGYITPPKIVDWYADAAPAGLIALASAPLVFWLRTGPVYNWVSNRQ